MKEILDKATCLISTNYSQMTGNMAIQLRNALRQQEIKFVVVKNRLAYIAADEIGKPEFKEIAKAYETLSLKIPEKSDTFAARIQQIKKKIKR